METVELKIEGMHCDGCVKSVTRVLAAVPGVEKAEVSLAEGNAKVSFDAERAAVAELKQAIERAGFKAA